MRTDTPTQLLDALRASGLHPPERITAAERAVAAGAADAAVGDRLFAAGVLTPYQHKKVRSGRGGELLFGPYLVLDKVGEGGMGRVYKSVRLADGRMVALKVVRPHLVSNKTVISRYKREARAAAMLNHPNIVSLYDADEVDGRYFLAMEFVDGSDLSRMMREFGRPPDSGLPIYQEAAEYIRQAAVGLHHAHQLGMVHRDVKPSNLLVYGDRALPGRPGTTGVKLLDMGLVRSLLDVDADTATDLTRDGTVVGTPDYMAPEQAKNSRTVDHRADLYSLGCTLFYLLKGQPPFPDGGSIDKLLRHQLDPAPDLRRVRPDAPAGLIAVAEKLMQKRPDDRYQTAAEAAVALAPFGLSGGGGSRTVPAPAHEPFSFAVEPGAAPHTRFVPPAAVAGPSPGPTTAIPDATLVGRPTAGAAKNRPANRVPGAMLGGRPEHPTGSDSLFGPPRPPTKAPSSVYAVPAASPRRRARSRPAPKDEEGIPTFAIALAIAVGVFVLIAVVLWHVANRRPGAGAPGPNGALVAKLAGTTEGDRRMPPGGRT